MLKIGYKMATTMGKSTQLISETLSYRIFFLGEDSGIA